VYDYFLKDHLGNVRTVITTETQTDLYAATIESAARSKEVQLFSGITETATGKPGGFDTDGSNGSVARLNGNTSFTSNKSKGPGIVLKVMAGDTISLSTYGWYQGSTHAPYGQPSDIIAAVLSQFVGGATNVGGGKEGTFSNADITNFLTGALTDATNTRNSNNYDGTRPKAYLNWVIIREPFKSR
jgi:hypothetical protein